ncbi:expansin-like B1 [Typha angustifolia]|uniref:expansin-like B1 n=1 Tax=Typha angustifolia TaxID=59011 RepID=UPI003C2E93EE
MTSFLSFSCIALLFLFFPLPSTSQTTFTCSRAAYYGSPECSATPRGACGYGELGAYINGGDAAAVSRLYKGGAGCGACYQVKCTQPHLCNDDGVKVVVTDYGQGHYTDFILSARGFAKLAKPGMADELMAYGVAEVEYRRISCQYPGYHLMFRITEHSNYPNYIAFIMIYQAGQKDIVAVELWQEDCKEWRGMRRAYGGVWDMENPPKGPLNMRFLAKGEDDQNWVQVNGVIPYDWKAGVAYDSSIQLD